MQKLFAIGVIWVGCALAWMLLGTTIVVRGDDTRPVIDGEVAALWGSEMVQVPPTARPRPAPGEPTPREPAAADPAAGEPTLAQPAARGPSDVESAEDAKTGASRGAEPAAPSAATAGVVPLVGSDIDVALALEHRKKGLLWHATYAVDFAAEYTFANPSSEAADITLSFPLAGKHVIYDAFSILDEAGEPVDATIDGEGASWVDRFPPGEKRSYRVIYRSRGTGSWRYGASQNTAKITNFNLRLTVDSDGVDFPAGTLSPSQHAFDGQRWQGTWRFDSLVASAPIGVELPKKLDPGPLAAKITFFAPVSLLFFFFVVAILAAHRRKAIHPMNYFMLGCAFFAFHLLFAYLVDHVAVVPSFAIAALVSTVLVTSYARLFTGWRFALLEVGVSQLVYLVLFSVTFFWTGMTGLAVTIGAVLTLFVIMQITGRTRWTEVFASMRRDRTAPVAAPPTF